MNGYIDGFEYSEKRKDEDIESNDFGIVGDIVETIVDGMGDLFGSACDRIGDIFS